MQQLPDRLREGFVFGRLVRVTPVEGGIEVVYRPHVREADGGGVGKPVAVLLAGSVTFWDPRVASCSGKCVRILTPAGFVPRVRESLSVRLWGEDSAQLYGELLVEVWSGGQS